MILDAEEFSGLIGTAPSPDARRFLELSKSSLTYSAVTDPQKIDALAIIAQQAIWDHSRQPLSQEHRGQNWEDCWTWNLDQFRESPYEASLVPNYYLRHGTRPLRLRGRFIQPHHSTFQLAFFRALRAHLVETFVEPHPDAPLYEFGCGSGHNLFALKRRFGHRQAVIGADLSPSACTLANLVGTGGVRFDLLDPEKYKMEVLPESIVMTFGALEQVGTCAQEFINWLIKKRPRLCIHVEPLLEFYDQNDPLDRLPIQYHVARKYLKGLVPLLCGMQEVEIVAKRKVRFGDLFNDGYSFIVWRPK